MMTKQWFAMAAMELNNAVYAGGQSFSYDPGIEVASPSSDGISDELFHSITRVSPMVEITTLNLADLLDASVLDIGESVPQLALDGTNGLQLVGRLQATDGPTFAAGVSHEQIQILNGLAYLTGISGRVGEDATLTMKVLARSSDGSTDPVGLSQVAAPSDPASIAPYILDSISVGGTTIEAIEGFDLSLEAAERIEHGPHTYPVFTGLGQGAVNRWRLTIEHQDLSLLRSVTPPGAEQQVIITLKAKDQGGTRGSSTVTITATNGVLVPRPANYANGENASMSHEFFPRLSGATLPITIAQA